MSTSLGKCFGLSSSLKEEVTMTKKQGIGSILEYDSERTKSDASLKRTLSADMSSKKWLSQHGFFFPLKKIPSSDGFQVSFVPDSSSSEEDDYEERHHAEEKKKEVEEEEEGEKQPGRLDIWSSILSQMAQEDSKNLPPPYVHPLVKRSASSLSGKSLEICTESLGSETGSGGFSSYPPSETGDTGKAEEDKEEEHYHHQQQQQEKAAQKYDMEDWREANYKFVSSKKTSPRSFPPPIPLLSSQDGTSVHLRSRRDNGRLVLESVSVPSQNNFRAQRQDGRLVLTFINKTKEEEQAEEEQEGPKNEESKEEKNEVDQFELELDNSENEMYDPDDEEEEEETEEDVEEEVEKAIGGAGGAGGDGDDLRFVMELAPKFSSDIVSFHRLAPMMNKSMLLAKRNPTWPESLNKTVNFGAEEEEEAIMKTITPLTQSLPPEPPVAARMIPSLPKATVAATAKAAAAAAASLNAYEYYWKSKAITVTGSVLNAPIAQNQASRWNSNKLVLSKNIVGNEENELLVLRGNNGDYFVPLFKGCKEPRRSLLFLEPYCIATS